MSNFCKLLLLIILISQACQGTEHNKILTQSRVLKADLVEYNANTEIISAQGNVKVLIEGYILRADSLGYDLKNDIVWAKGNLRITDEKGQIIVGESAIFKNKLMQGIIEEFILKFSDNSILVAKVANRLSKNRATLGYAKFTPCTINCGKSPIWQMSAKEIQIDEDKKKLTYKHLFFEIYGVPVVYLPYFSHPTPNAPARSGILVPTLNKNDFIIPFYFRAKPNLDFTISPRLSKNYTIFEGEFRHNTAYGNYKIVGSYGNPPFKRITTQNLEKDSRSARYHIFAKGDFVKNNINYGFDINRTLNKTYLINYHEIYDSFLISKLYANKIEKRDYFSIETFYFQDLRANNLRSNIPIIMPQIKSQRVIPLNEDESIIFNVKNHTIAYKESSGKQLARTALELGVADNYITDNGQRINTAISNRSDLYLVSLDLPEQQRQAKESAWYRNIPELKIQWRYPFTKPISSKSSIKLEPIIMGVLGRKYESRFNKFVLVDASNSELSENNIFNSNKFSGIDYHDYGSRLSYGINSSILSNLLYCNVFLGQLLHKNNITRNNNAEFVCSTNVNVADTTELYYSFRKDKNLKAIRDEISIISVFNKLTFSIFFTSLNNVSRYYYDGLFKITNNHINQLTFNINYQLSPALSIETNARFDDIDKKTKILYRSIKMTYLYDCVSITGRIYDDYTSDILRGVRKNRSKSFSIGLKVLNM